MITSILVTYNRALNEGIAVHVSIIRHLNNYFRTFSNDFLRNFSSCGHLVSANLGKKTFSEIPRIINLVKILGTNAEENEGSMNGLNLLKNPLSKLVDLS